ncbi:MAG: aminotransferase-like domain-containing protein [Dehalococcoidia bacterium]
MVSQRAVSPAAAAQKSIALPWDVAALERLLAGPARTATGWSGAPPLNKPLVPFTAGVPDAPTFPVAEIGAAVQTVLSREAAPALEYLLGTPQGEPALRELVVSRMEPEPGLQLSAANVTITNGAAQALAHIFQTFLDPSDGVIVESPSYAGAIRAARGAAATLVPVPMDEHGLRIDALDDTLERLAAAGQRPKLIYAIPTFHNPAGVTMPLERRRQLIEVAARHQVLIVEDDAYGELRYTGEPIPSVFALAGGIGVLRCGTISKTIAPGLRVGWIKGQPAVIDALVRMRFDNGTSPFAQRIVVAYVEAGAFEPHVELMRGVYKRKYETMDAALGEYCGRYTTWTEPDGGFFIWMKLPDSVDCLAMQEVAWDEGVGYFPGTSFFTDGQGHDFIRLAFSAVTIDQIHEGCARLGRTLARATA